MLKRIRKSLRNEKGFTILELIVVIAIMGFLIALVAPKLGDVAENSHGNISLTNMQRLNEAVGRYVADNGKLPNKLGNGTWLGRKEVDGTFKFGSTNSALSTVKSNPANNQGDSIIADPNEKLSALYSPNFTRRHGIVLHDLTPEEADDIKSLGINTIIDYETNKEIPVKEGCRVMMIGTGGGGNEWRRIGNTRPIIYGVKYEPRRPNDMEFISPKSSAAEGIPAYSPSNYLMHKKHFNYKGNYHQGFDLGRLARPELVYRIVLAIGEDSDVAEKGYLKNIGMDPAVVDIKEYVQMTEYGLVLPRLQATLDRVNLDTMPAKIKVNGYDKDGKPTGQQKIVDVSKAQTIKDVTIIGQGEAVYPISDVYEWEVDTIFDKDGRLIEHKDVVR